MDIQSCLIISAEVAGTKALVHNQMNIDAKKTTVGTVVQR